MNVLLCLLLDYLIMSCVVCVIALLTVVIILFFGLSYEAFFNYVHLTKLQNFSVLVKSTYLLILSMSQCCL